MQHAYSSTEINLFKGLYNSADHTPVIVAEASINNPTTIEEIKKPVISIYPNPTNDKINIKGLSEVQTIKFFALNGELIKNIPWNGNSFQRISLPKEKGIYLIEIRTQNQKPITQKVLHY